MKVYRRPLNLLKFSIALSITLSRSYSLKSSLSLSRNCTIRPFCSSVSSSSGLADPSASYSLVVIQSIDLFGYRADIKLSPLFDIFILRLFTDSWFGSNLRTLFLRLINFSLDFYTSFIDFRIALQNSSFFLASSFFSSDFGLASSRCRFYCREFELISNSSPTV